MKAIKAIIGIAIVLGIAWLIVKPGQPDVQIAETTQQDTQDMQNQEVENSDTTNGDATNNTMNDTTDSEENEDNESNQESEQQQEEAEGDDEQEERNEDEDNNDNNDNNDTDSDNEKTAEYTIVAGSTIQWLGKKVAGGEHYGDINITNGSIMVAGDAIVNGQFTIDMTSINATDIDSDSLDDHLKAEDYFDAANYPKAMFEITAIDANKVMGNLTIKDVTNAIEFETKTLEITDEMVKVSAEFAIDRSLWGVNGGMPAVSQYAELSFDLEFNEVE